MSKYRSTLTTLGLTALAIAAAGVAARHVPVANHPTLVAAAMSPYLTLCGPVALVLLLVTGRWIAAVTAACLTVAGIVGALPGHLGPGDVPVTGAPVRIMTANLKMGSADADALVSAARSNADVVAVQELTPEAADRISAAELSVSHPFRALYPSDEAGGAGLWSRYPISSAAPIWGFEMTFIRARITVKDVAVDPRIVVAHVSGPWPQPIKDWREDFELLEATMDQEARQSGDGAVVIAGDFNSTLSMRPFRRLLRNGYRDAAEQAGAGLTPTYPGSSWLPPLLTIDHLLVRNCLASAAWTVSLPGSDHRALVATVQFR